MQNLSTDGLIIESCDSANSSWLQYAIRDYGEDAVAKELEPIIERVISTTSQKIGNINVTGRTGKHDNSRLHIYKSFYRTYKTGGHLIIGPFLMSNGKISYSKKQ